MSLGFLTETSVPKSLDIRVNNIIIDGEGTITPSGTLVVNNITSTPGSDLNIFPSSGQEVNVDSLHLSGASVAARSVLMMDADSVVQSAILTNGQLLIGRTGNTPLPATLTTNANSGLSSTLGVASISLSLLRRCYVTCDNPSTIVPNSTNQLLFFNNPTAIFNPNGISNQPGGGSFDIPVGGGGIYNIQACVRWNLNTTGSRGIILFRNIVTTLYQSFSTPTTVDGECTVAINTTVNLNAGDIIQLDGHQDSGGNLSILFMSMILTQLS